MCLLQKESLYRQSMGQTFLRLFLWQLSCITLMDNQCCQDLEGGTSFLISTKGLKDAYTVIDSWIRTLFYKQQPTLVHSYGVSSHKVLKNLNIFGIFLMCPASCMYKGIRNQWDYHPSFKKAQDILTSGGGRFAGLRRFGLNSSLLVCLFLSLQLG